MYDSKNSFTETLSTGVKFQTFTGDSDSTNQLNLGVAGISFVPIKGQYLVCRVGVAFDALTSLEIIIETDSDTGFATTPKEVWAINVALADLSAGALIINQQIPVQKYQQFVQLKFNVVGSDNTVGTLVAYLQDHPESAEAQLDTVAL